MGPEQGNTPQTELTDEQVKAIVQERGLTLDAPGGNETAMSDEDKVSSVFEAMGGLKTPDGLSPEEKAKMEADLAKDMTIAIFQTEKQVASVFETASESQKFDMASFLIADKPVEALKLAKELAKAEIEKGQQTTGNEGNLKVEHESTAKSKDSNQNSVSSIRDLFGSGGLLNRIKRFGTS